MKAKRLFRAIGSVDDDLVQEAEQAGPAAKSFRPVILRWAAVAACLVLIGGIGIWRLSSPQAVPHAPDPAMAPEARMEELPAEAEDAAPFALEEDAVETEEAADEAAPAPESAPAVTRKFFQFGDYRYAFQEGGAGFDFSGIQLGDPLGTPDDGPLAGAGAPDADSSPQDSAVYAIPGYDPGFRLAVERDGEMALAELVGRVDGEPLGAERLVEVSDLAGRLTQAELKDHMGGETLAVVTDAAALTEELRQATSPELEPEDYEAIAREQMDGHSFQLVLQLNDNTQIVCYLLPRLGLISLGDDYYRLPESGGAPFGLSFDGLEQGPLPLQ